MQAAVGQPVDAFVWLPPPAVLRRRQKVLAAVCLLCCLQSHPVISTMSGSPRSVLEEARAPGLRALVLGGGLAGLVSAAVACKHFDQVTLIDADRLGPASDAEQVRAFCRRCRRRRSRPHTPAASRPAPTCTTPAARTGSEEQAGTAAVPAPPHTGARMLLLVGPPASTGTTGLDNAVRCCSWLIDVVPVCLRLPATLLQMSGAPRCCSYCQLQVTGGLQAIEAVLPGFKEEVRGQADGRGAGATRGHTTAHPTRASAGPGPGMPSGRAARQGGRTPGRSLQPILQTMLEPTEERTLACACSWCAAAPGTWTLAGECLQTSFPTSMHASRPSQNGARAPARPQLGDAACLDSRAAPCLPHSV